MLRFINKLQTDKSLILIYKLRGSKHYSSEKKTSTKKLDFVKN